MNTARNTTHRPATTVVDFHNLKPGNIARAHGARLIVLEVEHDAPGNMPDTLRTLVEWLELRSHGEPVRTYTAPWHAGLGNDYHSGYLVEVPSMATDDQPFPCRVAPQILMRLREDDGPLVGIPVLSEAQCEHIETACGECIESWCNDYEVDFDATAAGRDLYAAALNAGLLRELKHYLDN